MTDMDASVAGEVNSPLRKTRIRGPSLSVSLIAAAGFGEQAEVSMRKLRIFLAEYYQMIREGLKAILNGEPSPEPWAAARG